VISSPLLVAFSISHHEIDRDERGETSMTNEIPPLDETPPCECGARMSQGAKTCRKCASVLRWQRRQAKRRKLRRPSTRPAGRPRRTRGAGTAAMTVMITNLAVVDSGVMWS
jgi:hypothetical protein